MIANDRFVSCFGIVPEGEEDALAALVRNAVRQGFAVVPVVPAGKEPLCTLTARQAKTADQEAQAAAKEAGRRNWDRVRHACSINHALTDPAVAHRVIARLRRERPALNIGVEVGHSRMVLVDLDTAAERDGFLSDWTAATEEDMSGRRPTVTTPGLMRVDEDGEERWIHKDGGHFWFSVPEGVDLAALPGEGALKAASGWTVYWRNRQALVPPSVRPEGPYAITGQSEPCPTWLLEIIQAHAAVAEQRRAERAERIRYADDPIDAWSAATPWGDLLGPDGWTETAMPDGCGCPSWTRPGDPAHSKSATAHEDGCVRYDTTAGHGPLHVWSDNPPEFLQDAVAGTGSRTLTKLQYVAWRDHDGDAAAAMRALDLGFRGGTNWAETEPLFAGMDDAEPPPVPDDHRPEPEPETPIEAEVPDELAELVGNPRLYHEVRQLHTRRQAQEWYERWRNRSSRDGLRDRIRAARDRLSDLDDLDEEPIPWRIEGLWQQGQTVLLTAQYKAGKTTMVLNVIRSLVDGKPFLGQFETTACDRNVYVVNAEMTGRQFRRWLREAGIQNREQVYALHVREAGTAAGDILDPTSRALLIEELRETDAQVLILDPLNPLLSASGVDENASTEVAKWFNALAEIVANSPVEDVLLVHHFGHSGERGRGSSKFMDAPDAIWTYTKAAKAKAEATDDDDLLGEIETAAEPRYLAAIGRDVELPKSRVDFIADTRTLTMPVIGEGARNKANRERNAELRQEQMIGHICSFVVAKPGITMNALFELVRGKKDTFRGALDEAVRQGVLIEEQGPNRSRKFAVAAGWDPVRPSETQDHGPSPSGGTPGPPVGGPGPTEGPTEDRTGWDQDSGPTGAGGGCGDDP